MEKKEFITDAGTITYWISRVPKTNAPCLVFLPGLSATWRLFEKQIEYFEDKANIFVWDGPSHGDSKDFQLTRSIDDLAHYLSEILKHEHIEKPILIGQSMGGIVAQAYAHAYPDFAAGIISIDSFPLKQSYYKKSDVFFLKHTQAILSAIPWNMLIEGSALANAQTEYGRKVMREMVRAYGKRKYVALTAHGFRAVGEALEHGFAEYDCPLLVVCGENDTTGSVKKFNAEWERRENVIVKWIPDAMHNSTSDNPEAVNNCIKKFLEEIT